MNVRIVNTPWEATEADWLIVGVPEGSELSSPLAQLDKAWGGRLARLARSGRPTGKMGELVPLRDAAPSPQRACFALGWENRPN